MVYRVIFKTLQVFLHKAIVEILFPKRCISCGEYSVWFCRTCEENARVLIEIGCCAYCTKRISSSFFKGALCNKCKKRLRLEGCLYYYSYKSRAIEKTLRVIKYRGVEPCLSDFAEYIYEQFISTPYVSRPFSLTDREPSSVTLIPIPQHSRKTRTRGFNQAEQLAYYLGKHFGWKVDASLLGKKRATLSQTKLTLPERQENMENVFFLTKPISKNTQYVIVDDVITTGITISEASKILRKNGAKTVWALTIARG